MRRFCFLMLATLIVLTGCSKVSDEAAKQPRPLADRSAEATDQASSAMRDILGMMHDAVAPEPSHDVANGMFLGRVAEVDARAIAVDLDFVTPDMQPGLSKAQRAKSSWPDYYGWNRYEHRQRFGISNAVLITGGQRFEPVTAESFVRDYAADSTSDELNYYVLVRDGEIEAMWPWQP